MSTSGIFVRAGGLERLLADLKDVSLIYLREDGEDVRGLEEGLPADAAYILGDHLGMTAEEERLIGQAGAKTVSLGATSLHADHCIVLLNWILDANLFTAER
jgi:tRNA (pseudouridine54-N1)-methyltransferase